MIIVNNQSSQAPLNHIAHHTGAEIISGSVLIRLYRQRASIPGKRCTKGEAFLSQGFCGILRSADHPQSVHPHGLLSRTTTFWTCRAILVYTLIENALTPNLPGCKGSLVNRRRFSAVSVERMTASEEMEQESVMPPARAVYVAYVPSTCATGFVTCLYQADLSLLPQSSRM